MKILTLNINMFLLDNDNSFWKYFEDISPDLAFIQEFRYNHIGMCPTGYNYKFPNSYDGETTVDSRDRITIALSKYDLNKIEYDGGAFDYTIIKRSIELNNMNKIVMGVHLPLKEKTDIEFNRLKNLTKADIICGDFNANKHKKNKRDNEKYASVNIEFLRELLDEHEYECLWEKGKALKKAFYINYKGEKINTTEDVRTYVGNTHVDYILAAKGEIKNLNEIIIDMRTFTFTDHAALIADVDLNN